MADFSFLLGGGYKPPEIDVYGPYKQALTLRQLADAREYQRAQTERVRLQAMQERQEMAEMESFRREYKPGMAPDEVMRRWPTYGPKALTAQGQALTQQRLAETQKRLEEEAKARLDKAAAEKQDKIRQQVANIGMQAAGLENKPQGEGPDFEKLSPREQFFNTQVASALIDQGIVPAEQFGAFQMPQDMAAAKRAYGAAYSPKEVQAYEAGEQTRKNTALEILGKQWEDVSRRLEGVTGQPSWTKLLGELPPEISSQFKAEFSPPELARAKKMALSSAQRIQQEGQEATRKATQSSQRLTQAGQIRDDYRMESKNYVIVRDAFQSMQDAAKLNTGPGDLGVVFQSFRMQDPGSTVSTGEQLTAKELGTFPDHLRVWAQRLIEGKTVRLPENVRREFIALGNAKFQQMSKSQEKIDRFYRALAERHDIDPADVLIDYTPDETAPPAPSAAAPPQTGGGGMPATLGGIPNPLLNNEPPVRVRRDANGRLVK